MEEETREIPTDAGHSPVGAVRPLQIVKRSDENTQRYQENAKKPGSETGMLSRERVPELTECQKFVTIPKRIAHPRDAVYGSRTKENMDPSMIGHEDIARHKGPDVAAHGNANTPELQKSTSSTMPQGTGSPPASPGLSSTLEKRDAPLYSPTESNWQNQRYSPAANETKRLFGAPPATDYRILPRQPVSSPDSDSSPSAVDDSSPGTNPPSPTWSLASHTLRPDGDGFEPFPAYVMAPKIEVTPETWVLDTRCTTLWVAVEVSTQLCRATGTGGRADNSEEGLTLDALGPDTPTHGCLHDVRVRLGSTPNSSIIEFLEDKCASTTLRTGCKLLVLAHIQVAPVTPPPSKGHRRQRSEELMQDLEYQLGATTTEYLNVQVTFRHSGFPHAETTLSTTGIARISTTAETYATAVIERHDSCSLWSRLPGPQDNPLFSIVGYNWGFDAANDVMRHIQASQSALPRAAYSANRGTNLSLTREPWQQIRGRIDSRRITRTAPLPSQVPLIPVRQASLGWSTPPASGEQQQRSSSGYATGTDSDDGSDTAGDYDSDPARRIWREMRRQSKRPRTVPKTRIGTSTARCMDTNPGNEEAAGSSSFPASSSSSIQSALPLMSTNVIGTGAGKRRTPHEHSTPAGPSRARKVPSQLAQGDGEPAGSSTTRQVDDILIPVTRLDRRRTAEDEQPAKKRRVSGYSLGAKTSNSSGIGKETSRWNWGGWW